LYQEFGTRYPVQWDAELTLASQLQLLRYLTQPSTPEMPKLTSRSKVLVMGANVFTLACTLEVEVNCWIDLMQLGDSS
jgi:hypothetical protein